MPVLFPTPAPKRADPRTAAPAARWAPIIALIGAMSPWASPAAQEKFESRVEITPFIGYRAGGGFELEETGEDLDLADHGSFLLAVDIRRDELAQYELLYARQRTRLTGASSLGRLDVDVEYLHAGGTLVLNDDYRFAPYVVGTAGVTRFKPSPPGADDETRVSISLGLGLRAPLGERLSLRLEARGYLTFLKTDTAVFCLSDEQGALCRIRTSGSSFVQYEALAGMAFAF